MQIVFMIAESILSLHVGDVRGSARNPMFSFPLQPEARTMTPASPATIPKCMTTSMPIGVRSRAVRWKKSPQFLEHRRRQRAQCTQSSQDAFRLPSKVAPQPNALARIVEADGALRETARAALGDAHVR